VTFVPQDQRRSGKRSKHSSVLSAVVTHSVSTHRARKLKLSGRQRVGAGIRAGR